MKTIIFFCSLLFLIDCHQHWWENSKVQELTTENFYDFVGKSKHVIVEFYAPWCFYCQAMFQEYENLRELYNGENPKRNDVLIAKINGNAHEQITQSFGIYSYPTIVFFPLGKKEINGIFQQHRTRDVMSKWIEHLSGPEIKEEVVEEVKENPPQIEENNIEKKEAVDEKEDNKKILDILITVADELKFLDKIHREDTEKIMAILQKDKQEPETIIESSVKSLGMGVNFKHVSIFFILGVVVGLAFAFTLIKIKKLNQVNPLKNV